MHGNPVHPRPVRRQPMERRLGIRPAHPGPGVPPTRPARCEGGGPRMITIPNIPESVVVKHGSKAWPLGLAGAGLLIIGSLLSWCFDPQVLGNLSISLNPGGLQI